MPMYKTCPICGDHLDPGEHHVCDDYEVPEVETARRGIVHRNPDPYEEALQQAWLEYELR